MRVEVRSVGETLVAWVGIGVGVLRKNTVQPVRVSDASARPNVVVMNLIIGLESVSTGILEKWFTGGERIHSVCVENDPQGPNEDESSWEDL